MDKSRIIKFRGKRVCKDEWVYGHYSDIGVFAYAGKKGHYIITGIDCYSVIPETIGQFTGLHDATTWEELTEEVRTAFWNANKSEDGLTIKYKCVDAVKHLWKGWEIWEGDVLKCKCKIKGSWDSKKTDYEYKHLNFAVEWYSGHSTHGHRLRNRSNHFPLKVGALRTMEAKVIGSIHTHPELLKGE